MADLLLAGTTHYPLLMYTDDAMTSQMERHWKSDRVPEYWRDQRNWPKAMQEEYGPDGANGPPPLPRRGIIFQVVHHRCLGGAPPHTRRQ